MSNSLNLAIHFSPISANLSFVINFFLTSLVTSNVDFSNQSNNYDVRASNKFTTVMLLRVFVKIKVTFTTPAEKGNGSKKL